MNQLVNDPVRLLGICFDSLGYHFRLARLTVATETLMKFVERVSRFYDQEPAGPQFEPIKIFPKGKDQFLEFLYPFEVLDPLPALTIAAFFPLGR